MSAISHMALLRVPYWHGARAASFELHKRSAETYYTHQKQEHLVPNRDATQQSDLCNNRQHRKYGVMTYSILPGWVCSMGNTFGCCLASFDMVAAMAAVRSNGEVGLNSRSLSMTRGFSGCFAACPITAIMLPSACLASCRRHARRLHHCKYLPAVSMSMWYINMSTGSSHTINRGCAARHQATIHICTDSSAAWATNFQLTINVHNKNGPTGSCAQ